MPEKSEILEEWESMWFELKQTLGNCIASCKREIESGHMLEKNKWQLIAFSNILDDMHHLEAD